MSETAWSDWLWDASRNDHYKVRVNAQGEAEYQFGAAIAATPRAEVSIDNVQNTNPGYGQQQNYGDSSQSYHSHHQSNLSYGSTRHYTTAPAGASVSHAPRDPQHIKTRDATTDKEPLDPSFGRITQKRQKDFFKAGRVFAVLWTESASQDLRDDMADAFSEVKYGQAAHTEVRRFIVIASHEWHSLCVPIASYRRRGTGRRPDMAHHSVAYGGTHPPEPLPDERLDKHPIRVALDPGEALDVHSRINFSKIYTVEHNVKVKKLGKVDQDYLATALYYARASSGIGPTPT